MPVSYTTSIAEEFAACRPVLSALGDETRQSIILCLVENCQQGGLRVGELSEVTGTSRTALSHHLKILKEAEVISMRREGTRNYYYMNPGSSSFQRLTAFWNDVAVIGRKCKTCPNKMCGGAENEDYSS